jgi:hypothetical protein
MLNGLGYCAKRKGTISCSPSLGNLTFDMV